MYRGKGKGSFGIRSTLEIHMGAGGTGTGRSHPTCRSTDEVVNTEEHKAIILVPRTCH